MRLRFLERTIRTPSKGQGPKCNYRDMECFSEGGNEVFNMAT